MKRFILTLATAALVAAPALAKQPVWPADKLGKETSIPFVGTIGLYSSIAGARSGTVRQDKVDEYSGALYAEGTAALTDRLRLTLGLRGDIYGYDVDARTLPINSGKGSDALFADGTTDPAVLAARILR